jgi:hypothetical protein
LELQELALETFVESKGDEACPRRPTFHRPDPGDIVPAPKTGHADDPIARARRWLDRQPPAAEGRKGSPATCRIASLLTH